MRQPEQIAWVESRTFGWLLVRRNPCLVPRVGEGKHLVQDIPIDEIERALMAKRRPDGRPIVEVAPKPYHRQLEEDFDRGCRGMAIALLLSLLALGLLGIGYGIVHHIGPFNPANWN